jgi:hypothetical protein
LNRESCIQKLWIINILLMISNTQWSYRIHIEFLDRSNFWCIIFLMDLTVN